MHELSIVMGILKIAQEQLSGSETTTIDEIELEIGELSGVDMSSFNFAWSTGIKQTPLEKAKVVIHQPKGQAVCLECNHSYPLHHIYDPCSQCGSQFVQIARGKELRVKSLVVS